MEQERWRDAQKYIDQIRVLVEAGDEPDANGQDAVLAALPSSVAATEAAATARELTALIVMPPGVQRKAVSNRLSDHRFSVSFAVGLDEEIGAFLAVLDRHTLEDLLMPRKGLA